MVIIKRLAAAVSIGAAIAAAMLLADPGEVHADTGTEQLGYLQELSDLGVHITDTTAALATGYWACEAMNTRNGYQVAVEIFASTSWSEFPTIASAAKPVIAAGHNLCPWHVH